MNDTQQAMVQLLTTQATSLQTQGENTKMLLASLGAVVDEAPVEVGVSSDNASICWDFQRGRCQRGAQCRFSHESDEQMQSKRNERRKRLRQSGVSLTPGPPPCATCQRQAAAQGCKYCRACCDGLCNAVKHQGTRDSEAPTKRSHMTADAEQDSEPPLRRRGSGRSDSDGHREAESSADRR